MMGFLGLNMALYFSSQGAAKIIGPVLAGSTRLVFIVVGGLWLTSINATDTSFFILAATSMVALGLATATVVYFTSWAPKPAKT